MKTLRHIGAIVVGSAVLFGFKLYTKSNTRNEMHAKLATMCETETSCVAALDAHFDGCFEANYDLGSRTHPSGVSMDTFLACFNQRAGTDVFTSDDTATAH